MTDSKILVTAATGNVGQFVAEALQKKQIPFTAATRDAGKAKEKLGDSISTVYLDFEDKSTFAAALEGKEIIFLSGPSATPGAEDMIMPLAEEAKKQGVRHVVFMAVYPKVMDFLKENNITYTFIKGNFFMQNFEMYQQYDIRDKNQIFMPTGNGKAPFIHTRDIGYVVGEVISRPEAFKNETLYLTGSEAIDHYQAAEIFSEVLGRKIEYVNPDDDTYRKEMEKRGYDKSYIDAMISVFGKIKSGDVEQTSDTVGKILKRKPVSLKEYVIEKKNFFSGS